MDALLTQTVIENFKNAVPADVIKSVRKVCEERSIMSQYTL